MATKGSGENTHKATEHGSPAKACQLWARGRRKIARKSPETRQPSPILQPWADCLQVRDKKQPDGNEGPTLQSVFFFEFLEVEGGSAHSVALSNGTSCVPITHQQKNVAADFGSRSDARSDHGRSRRSRAILRPQRPRDTKPHTLSELFLEFPLRVRLGSPKPYNSKHLKPPKHFRNSLPPVQLGTPLFFRSGSGEGLSSKCNRPKG